MDDEACAEIHEYELGDVDPKSWMRLCCDLDSGDHVGPRNALVLCAWRVCGSGSQFLERTVFFSAGCVRRRSSGGCECSFIESSVENREGDRPGGDKRNPEDRNPCPFRSVPGSLQQARDDYTDDARAQDEHRKQEIEKHAPKCHLFTQGIAFSMGEKASPRFPPQE